MDGDPGRNEVVPIEGRAVRAAVTAAEILGAAYAAVCVVWISVGRAADSVVLRRIMAAVPPFTTGSYLVAAAATLSLWADRSLIRRVLMCGIWSFMALFPLIGLMGSYGLADLLIYAPHLVLIAVAVPAVRRSLSAFSDRTGER